MNRDGSFDCREPQVAALPCDALWSYVGVACVAGIDSHYPYIEMHVFLHFFVCSFHLGIFGNLVIVRFIVSSWICSCSGRALFVRGE